MSKVLFQARRFINRSDEIKTGIVEEGVEPVLGTIVLAENIDVDNYGLITMRKGTSQVVAAATHSFYTHPFDDSTAYLMVGNTLSKLNDDYSTTEITTLSNSNELIYDLCGTEIVATNSTDIGFINGTSFDAFSQATGQFEELMPAGQFLIYDLFDNCLLVVKNNVIHRSKPYNPQILDRRYSDFPFIGDIWSIGIVEDGWYVGTSEGMAFVSRSGNDGFSYSDISSVPPINGCFYNGWEYMKENRRRIFAWASKDGITVGYKGGEIKNLSYPTVGIENGESGKLVYREINGTFQFIAIIRKVGDGYKYNKPTIPVTTVNV